MVYSAELLVVMTDRLKIFRIHARNVKRVHGHKRIDDDTFPAFLSRSNRSHTICWGHRWFDNPVNLKSRLTVTQDHWKRNHWVDHNDLLLDELLDVEYYRDLETLVWGHSRSLKVVQFQSLGAVSYSPFIVTMAVSVAVCEIFNAKNGVTLKLS